MDLLAFTPQLTYKNVEGVIVFISILLLLEIFFILAKFLLYDNNIIGIVMNFVYIYFVV